MRRSGVFGFIAVGLLAAVALVLWLGRSGDSDASGTAALVARTGSTDSAGNLPKPPATRGHDQAPASASLDELPPPAVEAPRDPIPASYRQALGALTGRVVQQAADSPQSLQPVPGLAIELVGGRASTFLRPRDALLDPAQLEPQLILGATATDDEGRFRIEGIDPRTIGALLLDPGGPRALFWPLEITPQSAQTADLGDLVLPAMATLFGTIADERGTPVEGARVRATDLPLPEAFSGVADFRAGGGVVIAGETEGFGNHFYLPPPSLARLESRLPFPTTHTDSEGRFELTGVPPGLVVLVVDDGLHLPLARTGVATGPAGGRRDLGTITVGDGLPLLVKVRTSDGQNVPEAQVFAGNQLPMAPVAVMKVSHARGVNGSAQFSGMAKGPAWVAARADERHGFTVLSVPEVAVGEATVTLPAPRKLTVTVLDADGLPVTGANFYGRVVQENQTPDFLLPPTSMASRTEVVEPGRYLISDLEPTAWELTTMVPGHPQHRLNADLSAGNTTAEVRLQRGLSADVRVVAAGKGTPIEYALVQAYPDEEGFELKLFESPSSTARTDAAGLAHFATLPAGSLRFVINHPAYAITELEAALPATAELRAELSAGGSIAGQVLELGAPPAEPLAIMLMPMGGSGDNEMPRFTLTDRDGAFHFTRVDAGEVQLEARSRMEIGAGLSVFEAMFNSPLAEANVTVPEGGEAQVVLQVGAELEGVETGFVSGQLTVNGAPAEGWKIRTWGRIRRSVSTDAQGRFDLGRIAAGKPTLLISAPSQTMGNGYTDQRELELKADEQQFVPIDLTAGAISGRVISAATGQPLAGVEVNAASAAEQDGWSRKPGTLSAPDGSFTIEPVVTGRYTLRARAEGYAQASSEPFDVTMFQTRSGLELRLPKGLVVRGTITLEGVNETPDWIWITATGGPGGNGHEGARVEGDKLDYSFERLGPGEWEFEVNSSLSTEFAPIKLTLTTDTNNLHLTFKPLPPEPPQPDGSAQPFVYEVK